MTGDSDSDVFTDERQVAPAHYTLKIDSWSLLLKMLAESYTDKYESRHFEVSGYKWKLALYPKGDKKKKGDGHISLYLMVAETNGLPPGWEINTLFRFFVYDQLQDKYLTIEDGKVKRYCALNTKWGFPQLLPLATLNDASKGYLVDDSCAFGVEVFVIKSEGRVEVFSLKVDPPYASFTWKIDKFSELAQDFYVSKGYSVGGHTWKLKLYPDGFSEFKQRSLSLFLRLDDYSNLPPGWKIFVEYTIRVRNQVTSHHKERKYYKWFNTLETSWGHLGFVPLSFTKEASNGLLVDDTLIVELIVSCVSEVMDFV